MEDSMIHQLADDMNDIYSYIYKEEWDRNDPPRKALSREIPYMNYRHIVRYMLHRERAVTYKTVGQAEGLLFGVPAPDHSTIGNSLAVTRHTLRADSNYAKLIHHIGFMFDLQRKHEGRREGRGASYADEISKMMNLPKHVLAITLASVSHHNIVHSSILNTLIREYEELDKDFVYELLSIKTEVAHV